MTLKTIFDPRHLTMLGIVYSVFSGTGVSAQGKNGNSAIMSMEKNSIDNTPKSITFSPAAGLQMNNAGNIFRDYLGIVPGGNTSMVLKSTTTTKQGVTTQRYTEYYKSIKVEYGGFTLTGKDGAVSFMTGNYYSPADNPGTTPAINESTALTKAGSHGLRTTGAIKTIGNCTSHTCSIFTRISL